LLTFQLCLLPTNFIAISCHATSSLPVAWRIRTLHTFDDFLLFLFELSAFFLCFARLLFFLEGLLSLATLIIDRSEIIKSVVYRGGLL